MEFKKVTISLPKNLYDQGINLVNKGFFSNFSDLVRSGIRTEFKEINPLIRDFDENNIYNDKELVLGVKESMKEAENKKGKILKSDKEMDEYFEAL
ncbi:MAG: hypothetical protein KJ583_04875 [Nanoarchaeota archaeon]|nr:hypothetical protein [Nanoarchaeota archaeon]MBU1270207.1 hypothetical protein [Nanoarchaeota archaeon]MBU1604623.1 hypothetical protein [Nanoarchaeota archaeon]MBU2443543.1 hypothetical protein [Nanoarchaeota archaeon]